MKDLKKFIQNLELSEGDSSLKFKTIVKKGVDVLEELEGNEGIMNFKSLCSFVAGISKQCQEDVLNSTLLAQRVATKAYPNDDEIVNWYTKYFEVLSNVGWVIENKEFASFKSKSSRFEIDNAILEILSAALTGNQLAVLTTTIKAFKSLSDNDKRFVAFEQNTHSLQKGSFQLGIATEEKDTISISASAFILKTNMVITKILFFESNKDSTELLYNISKATLNYSVYSEVRELIKEKLGDVHSFVANIEL
jgi:hypothetical protein